jgi:hypothetical protein
MLVTDNEARERMCPHFQATNITVRVADNASETEPKDYARCIGKACMAFRRFGWRDQGGYFQQAHLSQTEPSPPPSDYYKYEEIFYCGLAGNP